MEEARWLQAHGVDAVIAQGLEAGGHREHFLSDALSRQAGTFALLPRIVHAVDIPVIAAGGIADASGIRAAMALGAAGVQVGSSYLLCPEARISAVHRAALQGVEAGHTALTNIFTGRHAASSIASCANSARSATMRPHFHWPPPPSRRFAGKPNGAAVATSRRYGPDRTPAVAGRWPQAN